MKNLLFLSLSLTIACSLQAHKYTLSVCAVFKNESAYLKEWIEYHRLIGVDHFYLYNNGSVDPFRKVLSPYIRRNIVTLIHWADYLDPRTGPQDPLRSSHEMDYYDTVWALSIQVPAYENAAKWKAIDETKWLIFLDVDEFLVPCSKSKIPAILQQYETYPGVILTSEYYDASIRGVLPPRKLVIEATEIAEPPAPVLRRSIEKTLFKPELCTSISWPPYRCHFKDGGKAVKADRGVIRINRYGNRMRFQNVDKVKRKVQVKDLSEKEKYDLFKAGYEIEDPEKAIYQFVPDLYKTMGISSGDR